MDKSTDSSQASSGNSRSDSQTRDNITVGCGSSVTDTTAATTTSNPTSTIARPLPLGVVRTNGTMRQPLLLHPGGLPAINLNISTTTGGNFGVTVDPQISVENLKKIISKKLKVAKDRICLLHREKELHDGSLKDNNLFDGSKIILIPNVETGLLAQRPENTVMQALESLNDSQVNDFLSGKTPLNLSMRLGDHMMLIQLQLSTVNPASGNAVGNSSRTRSGQRSKTNSNSGTAALTTHHSHHHHHHHHHHPSATAASATSVTASTTGASNIASSSSTTTRKIIVDSTAATCQQKATNSSNRVPSEAEWNNILSRAEFDNLQNIVRSIMTQPGRLANLTNNANNAATNGSQKQQQQQQMHQQISVIPTTAAAPSSSSATTFKNQTLRAAVVPTASAATSAFHATAEPVAALLEQSPIKSLSNLVSSPIKTTAIKNIPIANDKSSLNSLASSTGISEVSVASLTTPCSQDPIAAKLTSCLCTRLNGGGAAHNVTTVKNCVETAACLKASVGVPTKRIEMHTSTPNQKSADSVTAAMLHKTGNNPITRSKHRHFHHFHHHHHHYHHHNGVTSNSSSCSACGALPNGRPKLTTSPRCTSVASNASSNDSGFASDEPMLASTTTTSTNVSKCSVLPVTSMVAPSTTATTTSLDDSGVVVSDTRTLAEASRNLTQTLRKLSKEVFTNKIDLSGSDETTRKSGSGAVIESMKNHGKGIYSGTFSGTLNPALQDRYGRPKRDISTVIHILNDLLSATPQYSRGARISFEAPTTSAIAANGCGGGAATAANNSTTVQSSRSKQLLSKHHHQHSHSCVKCLKTQQHINHGTSSNNVCAYGECNGHYVSKIPTKQNYVCCQHAINNAANDTNATAKDRNICTCRYRIVDETGERELEHTCQKCLVDMENLKTKSKLDQLRLVMQQRKQKREARKLKGAPYGARVLGASTTTATTTTTVAATAAATAAAATAATATAASAMTAANATTLSANGTPLSGNATVPPSEVSPNHIVEEVDTAA